MSKVLDSDLDKRKRHLSEAIWICKMEGLLKRDNSELSHIYHNIVISTDEADQYIWRKSLQGTLDMLKRNIDISQIQLYFMKTAFV